MRPRRFGLALLAILAVAPAAPAPVRAQVGPALVGAGVGFLGGGVATVSLLVARARWESEYVESVDDFIGLNGVPILVGTATGLAIGLWDEDRLRRSVIGSTGGMVVGFGVGWLAGSLFGTERTDEWAGAVIGAGLGLAAGALTGALWPDGGGDAAAEQPAAARRGDGLRLELRIPFR